MRETKNKMIEMIKIGKKTVRAGNTEREKEIWVQ